MEVEIKRLEDILGDNDSVETENLSLDSHLTKVSLRRVVDPDVNQLVLQHTEVIDATADLTDYAKIAELLAHLEGLKVNSEGDAVSGYALMQVITDSHGSTSSSGIAIGTDGSVKKVDGNTKITNQKQVDELVNPMLEALSDRKDDSRKIVRSIIALGRRAEAEGVVQRLDGDQLRETSKPSKNSDTIAKPKLSRVEVTARLDQIKSALRSRILKLSTQAS
ncbi:MAG: hypothetical protein KBC84_07425 [Proteobacteria bacterium]|nr:hypothetical protein [Pseudomonadota bacterium]